MNTQPFGSFQRKNILSIILWIGILILIGRLYQLQYIYSEELGKKSEENSIRKVTKTPMRGYIYDRNGILLVDNHPSYSVTLTPVDFDTTSLPLLSSIIEIPIETIREKIKKAKQYSQFSAMRLKRDVDFSTLSKLEEYKTQLSGIEVENESKRYYTNTVRASHLFGYAKEIAEWQLGKLGNYYQQGDIVGSAGLEAKYEKQLRGEKGYELIAQNAKGQTIGPFNEKKNDVLPKDGLELHLSLDAKVQALAESLLTNKSGAVVALDTKTGGVIAFVSKPDYDLSNFSGITPPEVWNALNNDEGKPLYNRATMAIYPPGSTFKMLLAIAALENHIIDEHWSVQCTGAFRFGNKIFKDLHVHGKTSLIKAIEQSCNVYFYQLMLKVGLDKWSEMCKQFGFGELSNIDILEENPGLIPSTKFFDKTYGVGKWTQGYLVSLGIGQGEVSVTPLQMANYTAMLANKGNYHQPHVVEKIYNKSKNTFDTLSYKQRHITISEKTWNLVREGMRQVVMEKGTGGGAKIPGIEVAGKTGTAQNPHGKDHSWFVGFAPFDNPQIAICVIVENAGYGGAVAAPIAGLCMEQYLYGSIIRNKKKEENLITIQQ